MSTYKDLIVWNKSITLVVEVYKLTDQFPREEIYSITSQIRRAAVSIPSNIAEGYNRNSLLEYIQFLSIAKGSATELETQLIICQKIEKLNAVNNTDLIELTNEIIKMLSVLIMKLKYKKYSSISSSQPSALSP